MKKAEYIAFYFGKNFKNQGFKIQYYGKINEITLLKRNELFPNEVENDKSRNEYYKIELDILIKRINPIISNRRRRIIFINSTIDKFFQAEELNDLFDESPIEEVIWKELKNNQIDAERQYYVKIGNKNYILDFALFCKQIKLAIECDGDTYHTDKLDVKSDKKRDNDLRSKGWSIMRYTTDEINYDTKNVVRQIKDTINQYGGLENNEDVFKFFPNKKDNDQFDLFDE